MKKTIIFGLMIIASSMALAGASKTVSINRHNYPGANLDVYIIAEDQLKIEARNFCNTLGKAVAKISDVNIKVKATFVITSWSGVDSLDASTYPRVNITALATCQD